MHLKSLSVTGFLKIKNLDLKPLESVNLIAGFNESGKTSLAEAIGFALRGLPERVQLKKHYGDLVNSAHDEARIVVDRDVEPVTLAIKRKTGRVSGGVKPENVSQAMHCALDMYHFANMDERKRRQMLFKLAGVNAGVEKVKELLKESGCNMEKVAEIEDFLLSGFDAAVTEAKGKISDCNKQWAHTTGEKYGPDKAEGWEPERPPEPEGYEEAETMRQELDQLTAEQKRIEKQRDEQAGARRQVDNMRARLSNSDGFEFTKAEYEQERDEVMAEWESRENEIALLREQLQAMESGEVDTYKCPGCEATLMFEGGELHHYAQPEYSEADIQQVRDNIESLTADIQPLRKRAESAKQAIQAIEGRESLEAELAQMGDSEAMQAEIEQLTAEANRLDDRKNELAEALSTIDDYEADLNEHDRIAKKAAALHNDSLEWVAIRDQLLPEGIPKLLMSKALDPINLLLQELSDKAGWAQVAIDSDMVITYGEYAYSLVSESAQWRTAAILSAAVSHLANINFLLLDRVDVLDMHGRSQMLDLAEYLANDKGMQIIMCATLKQPVQFDGVNCVWLQDGKKAA